jgi:hypothetical protein
MDIGGQEVEDQGSGFLITCDKNKEKQAIKDAYNFLNQVLSDRSSTSKTSMAISKRK